jgi:hypothetical protein
MRLPFTQWRGDNLCVCGSRQFYQNHELVGLLEVQGSDGVFYKAQTVELITDTSIAWPYVYKVTVDRTENLA